MTDKLWEPSKERASGTLLAQFMREIGIGVEGSALNYETLWSHSIRNPQAFWADIWRFCNVIGDRGRAVLENGSRLREARFFPDSRVNYAENLIRRSGDGEALIFVGEDGSRRSMSWNGLRATVFRLQSALRAAGVGPGDRVAGIVANTPEAAAAMIATAGIGAVWSSCSPDFGVKGVLDRFDQIKPKLLFCGDGYFYNGKWHSTLETGAQVAYRIDSVTQLVILPYCGTGGAETPHNGAGVGLSAFLQGRPDCSPEFVRMAFNDPLFIMFSSGTTGLPKCVVHGIGGSLIQHLKEHQLHCDIRPNDRVMFFTTCGWMMWNWLVSVLASEASVVLYDGMPLFPNSGRLADIAESEGVTHFGASAKYYDACSKAGVTPIKSNNLQTLRTILSTGSPLSPDSFNYIYREWKEDVCLSSISGGTDILGCFTGGCPVAPVFSGQCQKRLLGMDVLIFDESGHPVEGQAGELVCASPHPSMPTGFFNDLDGRKYRSAYFEGYPGVWTHGDWAELTEEGGVVFFGRSDATLNVSGVRIGTAEIYRPVEKMPEVLEALVIEHSAPGGAELVLFVRLREDLALADDLIGKIRAEIRSNASPRHLPAKVIAVADLPRTKSGKIVELAVRSVVHGQAVKNVSALANPEALDLFRDLPEIGG